MTKKQITVEAALHFMEVQFGKDIEIKSTELRGNYVNVIWKEVGDDDEYFSNVGYGRYGKVTELVGGWN
jgi:hypothetical protein